MTDVMGGDGGKEEAGMTVIEGVPTSIVVPASCRELLIQPTDFPTSSGVSLVPRLRGDDGKEEAGVPVIGGTYIYRRPGLVPGTFDTTNGFSYTFECFLSSPPSRG